MKVRISRLNQHRIETILIHTSINEDMRVVIKNGSVISVMLQNGKKIEGDSINRNMFKSVKQHFEYILEILKKEEREKSATIKVKYNKSLGYPSLININLKDVRYGKRTIYISNIVLN